MRSGDDLHIHRELILPLADGGNSVVLDAKGTAMGDMAASCPRNHIPTDIPRKIQDVGAASVPCNGAWAGGDYCHV